MALGAKRTETEHVRELERSQPEEIEKAERVVAEAGKGPAPISIRLSKPLLERLDRIAEREHRKRSNLIQYILWNYVHQLEDAQGNPR
jgi:predicted DNA-binding ribbon-helix-helix protein